MSLADIVQHNIDLMNSGEQGGMQFVLNAESMSEHISANFVYNERNGKIRYFYLEKTEIPPHHQRGRFDMDPRHMKFTITNSYFFDIKLTTEAQDALQATAEVWNNPVKRPTPYEERTGCLGYFLEKIGIKKK